MTINERIRYFRKEILKLNQRQFAADLGMAQTGISSLEREGATVTDRVIKSICLKYNVNEFWLLYGEDPMYIESDTFSLDEFLSRCNVSDLEIEFIKLYFELDESTRKDILDKFQKKFMLKPKTDSNKNIPDIPDTAEKFEKVCPPIDLQNEIDFSKKMLDSCTQPI